MMNLPRESRDAGANNVLDLETSRPRDVRIARRVAKFNSRIDHFSLSEPLSIWRRPPIRAVRRALPDGRRSVTGEKLRLRSARWRVELKMVSIEHSRRAIATTRSRLERARSAVEPAPQPFQLSGLRIEPARTPFKDARMRIGPSQP